MERLKEREKGCFFSNSDKKDVFILQVMQRQSNTILLISMESQPFSGDTSDSDQDGNRM